MIFQCFWLCDSWCVRFFSSWQKISCSSRKCASNIFLYRESQFRSVCLQVEYIPNTRGEEMMLVLQDRPVSSTCCTWKPQSPFFKSFPWHPLVPIGTNRSRSRGSTRSSMFVHDLGHSCPGRRVHLSGHPDFGMSSNSGALFSSWVRAAASAACDAKPGSHAMTSIAFADIWEADELCSFNMAYEPESIFHSITLEHNPASVLLLLQLWLRIFWEDRSPSVSTTELVLCGSRMTSFSDVHLPTLATFRLTHSLSTAAGASRIFIDWGRGAEVVHQNVVTHRIGPSLCHVIFMIFWTSRFKTFFSWIHEPPRCMHACSSF